MWIGVPRHYPKMDYSERCDATPFAFIGHCGDYTVMDKGGTVLVADLVDPDSHAAGGGASHGE